MKNEEIVKALRRLKVETGSLVCMGCGREHNCGILGCRIVREAAELIEKLADRCARYAEEIAVTQERTRWIPVTDAPLPECVACPDFVDKAQDDLEAFYGRADNDTN